MFDSDFGSTDSGSGAEDEGEDAGEKQLIQDAKAERRVRCRSGWRLCNSKAK